MIDLERCIAMGLIRKTVPSKEQAIASIEKAKRFLTEAKANLEDERFDSTVVIAYLAILNASRAFLFRDGYREKSHACITRYLEAKYSDKIPVEYIELLDHYRETRHDVQYEADYFSEQEGANQIVDFAEKFVKLAEKLLG
jgi:uncharacterized protein (UPF0332 family)